MAANHREQRAKRGYHGGLEFLAFAVRISVQSLSHKEEAMTPAVKIARIRIQANEIIQDIQPFDDRPLCDHERASIAHLEVIKAQATLAEIELDNAKPR